MYYTDKINRVVIVITTFCSIFLLLTSIFLDIKPKIILLLTSVILLCISYLSLFFSGQCFNYNINTIFEGACGYALCFIANLAFCIYLIVNAMNIKVIPRYYFELMTTLFSLFYASLFINLTYSTTPFTIALQYTICSITWFISIIINTIINYYITDG